jgi:hypothetical protein
LSDTNELLNELLCILPIREENVEAFDDLLGRIAEHGDPKCIGPLLDLLEDGFPLSGVMESVSGAVGAFGPETYVRELVERLPELRRRAPFRSENELKKFLWKERYQAMLIAALKDSRMEAKRAVAEMLGGLRSEVPELSDTCDALVAKIEQASI